MEAEASAVHTLLAGAQLQKARYDGAGGLSLKFRHSGTTRTLFLSSRKGAVGVGLIDRSPHSPANPHALTSYSRAHLEGGRLTEVRWRRDLLQLLFTRAGELHYLYLESRRDFARLFLADADGVVKVSERWDPEGGGVRPGTVFDPGELQVPSLSGTAEAAVEFLSLRGGALLAPTANAPGEAKAARRWRSRLMRRIEKIEGDLSNLPEAEGLTAEAEEAAANLWRDEGGGARIDALYRAAKKVRRARAIAAERLAGAREELDRGPPEPKPPAQGRPAGSEGSGPYRRYRSPDGWRILVGRNRIENDRLVRESRPWDLWLHALAGSGAHVVLVKPGKEATPPERTLLAAAGLAAHFSSLSGEKAVDVTVAEISRVSKPKGAGPGRVVVAGGRTVRVAPDPGGAKLLS